MTKQKLFLEAGNQARAFSWLGVSGGHEARPYMKNTQFRYERMNDWIRIAGNSIKGCRTEVWGRRADGMKGWRTLFRMMQAASGAHGKWETNVQQHPAEQEEAPPLGAAMRSGPPVCRGHRSGSASDAGREKGVFPVFLQLPHLPGFHDVIGLCAGLITAASGQAAASSSPRPS